MMQSELALEHRKLEQTLVTTARFNPSDRDEVHAAIGRLKQHVPEAHIAGPPFCIFHFITSVKDGIDAEVGFPVTQPVETDELKTKKLPAMEVLSLVHKGPAEDLGKSYRKLYNYAAEHALVSDEFCREVYLQLTPGGKSEIEIQFVVHNWAELLAAGVKRILGSEAEREVARGSDDLTIDSTVGERFQWVKGAVERLVVLADENEQYDILSRCAHVFPVGQIDKLRAVYEETFAQAEDVMEAVDSVLGFMEQDPGWVERPRREGNVIYSTKKPRDQEAYESAQDELEKKKAYCFCPLVREHLEEGMPITFCNCGAGWYRQQWEGTIGMPVTIQVLRSILKGDDWCEFAIQLPEDLK